MVFARSEFGTSGVFSAIHFVGFGAYAYQMIIGNQKFRAKFEIDETAATIMRMAGAIFFGSFLMALYIMFVRPNGVEGTWAFFNLIFVQNICVLLVNTYSLINALGHLRTFD